LLFSGKIAVFRANFFHHHPSRMLSRTPMRIANTLSHFTRSWHHALHSWGRLLAPAGARLGCWSNNSANSHTSPVPFNRRVLLSSAHTRPIDLAINDLLRIVTGCLRRTPADNLPNLADIQPAELRRSAATLSPASRAVEPGHLLHSELARPSSADTRRLKSRHPFVHTAHLFSSSDNNNIRAAQWADHQWNAEWADSPAWPPLHQCWTFPLLLVQTGMAPSAACECGTEEQTVDHVVLQCPIHRPPPGLHGLTVLGDETTEWLLNTWSEI